MSGASSVLPLGWFQRDGPSGGNPVFNSDGSITGGVGSANWFNPTTTGIGSSYWIRTTSISNRGSASGISPASGTWRNLGSGVSFGVLSGIGGATAFAEIAADSAGANVVFRGTVSTANDA